MPVSVLDIHGNSIPTVTVLAWPRRFDDLLRDAFPNSNLPEKTENVNPVSLLSYSPGSNYSSPVPNPLSSGPNPSSSSPAEGRVNRKISLWTLSSILRQFVLSSGGLNHPLDFPPSSMQSSLFSFFPMIPLGDVNKRSDPTPNLPSNPSQDLPSNHPHPPDLPSKPSPRLDHPHSQDLPSKNKNRQAPLAFATLAFIRWEACLAILFFVCALRYAQASLWGILSLRRHGKMLVKDTYEHCYPSKALTYIQIYTI